MASDNKYLDFIAYLQIMGIILVVFGHSLHEYPGKYYGDLIIYKALYSFRMPLFLFVSGFLMVYTTKVCTLPRVHPGRFIMAKVKRLLLPMVVLTAITFVPRSLMSFAADDSIPLNLHSFFMAFVSVDYMPIPYFWFLHVSFILLATCFTLLYLTNRLNINPLFTITLILTVLIVYAVGEFPSTTLFSLNHVKRIGLFFVLGVVYEIYFEKIDERMPWTTWWFPVLCLAAFCITFSIFENSGLILISSFIGILFCISISKIIELKNLRFLDHLKGANYLIFLLSWFLNVSCQQVLSRYTDFPWWFYSILSLVAGIYVPWLGYKYLNKHRESRWSKVTAFLLGQSLGRKTA